MLCPAGAASAGALYSTCSSSNLAAPAVLLLITLQVKEEAGEEKKADGESEATKREGDAMETDGGESAGAGTVAEAAPAEADAKEEDAEGAAGAQKKRAAEEGGEGSEAKRARTDGGAGAALGRRWSERGLACLGAVLLGRSLMPP